MGTLILAIDTRTTMKSLFLLVVVICSFALVRSESCVGSDISECRDTFCQHQTTLQCQLGLCTCSAPPYAFTCRMKGDCDRHTDFCNNEWKCINDKCRCP